MGVPPEALVRWQRCPDVYKRQVHSPSRPLPEPRVLGGLRKDIQGLAASAVVAVLLWHVDSATLPGGFAGVDVFFVVSGFLMTSLLAAPSRLGIREIADFYQRRVRRIIPAATVVLVVTAAGAAIRLDPSRWSQVGGDLVAATLFVLSLIHI